MLFGSMGDGFVGFLLLMGFGLWSAARMFKRFDTDGAVKDAAKRGAINQIGKWLK